MRGGGEAVGGEGGIPGEEGQGADEDGGDSEEAKCKQAIEIEKRVYKDSFQARGYELRAALALFFRPGGISPSHTKRRGRSE